MLLELVTRSSLEASKLGVVVGGLSVPAKHLWRSVHDGFLQTIALPSFLDECCIDD